MTMNIKTEAATQVDYFFQHLPRNPSMFSGEDGEDPHSWIKRYECIARHNHWDESLRLANAYFDLTGTAFRCYLDIQFCAWKVSFEGSFASLLQPQEKRNQSSLNALFSAYGNFAPSLRICQE
ncbi:ASPRV1 [Cordylochernes scorpioides]|uniref:ASPRV1 n=1 Tax=Cordylochernes scorpioides TaxID=51811 RepID=A0ABY6LSA5_9ARAC|nr:ASPRV1 [Cordylochernes scorpioides]